MIEQKELKKIEETTAEFFAKMTITAFEVTATMLSEKKDSSNSHDLNVENAEVINIEVKLDEPQILIGQGGQTLLEVQRLLKMVLNKNLQQAFYLNLDINDYKKKKVEYLKDLARSLADQVSLTKEEKILAPMSSYERRIIHAELSQRADVATESQGDGFDRHIIIKPK
jgi:spoIIIJ-associated protein